MHRETMPEPKMSDEEDANALREHLKFNIELKTQHSHIFQIQLVGFQSRMQIFQYKLSY